MKPFVIDVSSDVGSQHVDPVCGMTVSGDTPLHADYAQKTYFFCSEHCLHKFSERPEAYLGEEPGAKVPHHGSAEPTSTDSCSECANADAATNVYTCPMHPEVRQSGPGSCPKCGMALEPESPSIVASQTQYICPMHPEVVQDSPGNCPICGMALEPRELPSEEENPELTDMSRRFWVSSVLALPVFVLAMAADLAPQWLPGWLAMQTIQWVEFLLATPVVLWGGWPFFVRGWQSVRTWNLNMFTLIGLGVSVAWLYSVVALLLPGLFPPTMRHPDGTVAVYFEAAAVITALVLLGQVLELRARSRTGSAIRALLGSGPENSPYRTYRWHRGGYPA